MEAIRGKIGRWIDSESSEAKKNSLFHLGHAMDSSFDISGFHISTTKGKPLFVIDSPISKRSTSALIVR